MSASLVALEGIDGSGKGTQAELLRSALEAMGLSCGLVTFPRYSKTTFGQTIARYLNGEFGNIDSVGPHYAALLYAGDRFESLSLIEQERQSRQVLVFDRYVPSNLAHQAAKLPHNEQQVFIDWIESIEYGVYHLPRPDLVIWLNMPVKMAQKLIASKPSRSYTKHVADLHESDSRYLTETAKAYHQLASRGNVWHKVECCAGGKLRKVHEIHQDIRQILLSSGFVQPTAEQRA